MKPKEKAKELVKKFIPHAYHNDNELQCKDHAKQSALILADYVIQAIYQIDHKHTAVYDDKGTFYRYKECQELKYWQEVKQEIDKL